MTNPVFHPTTAAALARLADDLPQSLLLSGARGVGLTTAAMWLAGGYLTDHLMPRDAKGAVTASGTISVAVIRRLYEQTRSRPRERRVILISNADRMSRGASAAFLKLLEEPSLNTHFILTSHSPQLLLPTIRSRVQQAEIRPLSTEQTDELIKALGVTDPTKKAQLRFIATGLPAELSRLTHDEAYFAQHAQIVGDARDFLQADAYKKLLIVYAYRQDRTKTLQLIDAATAILRRSLSVKPQLGAVHQIDQLLSAREKIAANGNAILQLARFVI